MKYKLCAVALSALILSGCATKGNSANINALETITFDAEQTYDYENFTFDQLFDENTGYLKDIKALDYVNVPDFSTLQVKEDEITASDRDIKFILQQHVDSAGLPSPYTLVSDRMSKLGDTVTIDYAGKVNDIVFVGGSANRAKLELGSGTFIPGFEEQLVGHMPGDAFEITVTFPEGYGDAQDEEGNTIPLSGQDAVFAITLHEIAEWNVTDEWVKENTEELLQASSAQELDEAIRNIISNAKKVEKVSQLIEDEVEVKEIPTILIDRLATSALYMANKEMATMGITLEDLLQKQNISTQAEFLADYSNAIKTQAKQYLICQAIDEMYQINPNFTITAEYESLAQEYGLGYVRNTQLSIAAVEYVADHITVTP